MHRESKWSENKIAYIFRRAKPYRKCSFGCKIYFAWKYWSENLRILRVLPEVTLHETTHWHNSVLLNATHIFIKNEIKTQSNTKNVVKKFLHTTKELLKKAFFSCKSHLHLNMKLQNTVIHFYIHYYILKQNSSKFFHSHTFTSW